MNPAEFTIRKELISWTLVLLLLAGGYLAFQKLGRYEDPEFVIRQAVIITQYPGASAMQVAEEVTAPIEAAIQQLQEVKKIKSVSRPGESEVQVEVLMRFAPGRTELRQIWTQMRNKVAAVQNQLPPGAGPSIVNDDYGDVYAQFFALTGDGYSTTELRDYAEDLRKELLLVDGVARISFFGAPQEAVFVEISTPLAAALGVSLTGVYDTIRQQGLITDAGSLEIGGARIRISPADPLPDWSVLRDLQIGVGRDARLITLGDIAEINREVRAPARQYMRYNGQEAIGFGISMVSGGNVVAIGERVDQRIAQLVANRPLGMELHTISNQGVSVKESIQSFINNLLSAIAIVVVVLLLFMGLRSGLIIGFVLLLIVAGTLMAMAIHGIDMHRVSLGALIIALGMLVDNAIVVTDGMLVRIRAGEDRLKVAKEVVTSTVWPLLGGTAVGILAFSAIGFSPTNMGEYAGSLFWVIAYSLFLSWILAITITPLLCYRFLPSAAPGEAAESYDGFVYSRYRSGLLATLRRPGVTLLALAGLLVASIFGFRFVPAGFMPDSARPQFVVDVWLPQGSDIATTSALLSEMEPLVAAADGVTGVTSFIGSGGLRFMLTYSSESPNTAYGQLLVDVKDYRELRTLIPHLQSSLSEQFPKADIKVWKFMLGSPLPAKVEAVFRGPDPEVIRSLAEHAKAIMEADGGAVAIQDNWRNRVPVLRPVINEVAARRAGIHPVEINTALEKNYVGKSIGVFRDGDRLIPIVARAPEAERLRLDDPGSILVPSQTTGAMIPLGQLLHGFETVFEDTIVRSENRFLAIKAQCDPPAGQLAGPLFQRLRPQIEAIPLPPGYQLHWDGEYEASRESNAGLAMTAPYGFLAMILAVVIMFNGIRQPLIIWLAAPLSLIGVTIGLLLFQAPFEFMAILGFLSLIGMLVKNAIVLVDQIAVETSAGKVLLQAIEDSALSRMRPVAMGAITTILGVAPLLFDPFFRSMTIVIMFGLSFATLLTLFVVPVLYKLFFSKS
ncbi:MAG: efflux RND transporter permease subunit [Verrucomicrobia bacterium]|nr:efflux RND transporter permease subunit [Verrucomicrobiota bacterium]